MKYCRNCLQPDTRPSILFDSEGVCPACRFAENFSEIDWDKRRQEIEEIADYGRANNVSGYDCIIGVSGGKDSIRQAMFARDDLGLKPLLVCCSCPPEHLVDRGANNQANLISLGFDLITVGPAPETWKQLMRNGFDRFGNWCKSTEMALYASAPKVAVAYQIPLVFFGENPAITVGDLGVQSTSGDAGKMKNSNTIAGGIGPLMDPQMSGQDVIWYHYSSDEDMEMANLRIVYLGYYIPNFTKRSNGEYSIRQGMEVRSDPPEDIGDITGEEALDEDFVIINQMIKYLKYGFGKVTDQVCEEMRLGNMTRGEALDLVRKYDGKCADRYIEHYCKYTGLSRKKFDEKIDEFRNRDIWVKGVGGEWQLKEPLQ